MTGDRQWGRINGIDVDEDITLVNDQDDADMFDVNTLTGDEVLAEQEVAAKDVNLTVDEVTLAQALAALKSVNPKVKANVIKEPSVPVSATSTKVNVATTTTTAIILTPRKGIVITELEEPVKPKKKDLIRLDEEITSKLQDEFDEEERLAREKDEASVAQEELTDKEKARLFVQFLKQKKEEQTTNKSSTKEYHVYLTGKHGRMEAQKTELVEECSKKTETELEENLKKAKAEVMEGSSKRAAKVDDDHETTKIKKLMEIVPHKEEVAIDAIPLAFIASTALTRKIWKTLWKLVKAKHGLTRPDEGYERSTFLKDATHAHSLRMQHMHIHMLVEKRYPLTPATTTDMLNKKLQCDHFSEMGRIVRIKSLLEVTAAKVCVTAVK
ncbi:hypothetical protein Tco_0547663 [Tanacetum coccineum]